YNDDARRESSGSGRKQQCSLLHGPSPSLSLRYPHEARAQIGKSCGANGASPLGQRCTPRLLFLRRDVSEPPVELGRAVARIRAGNERLIVHAIPSRGSCPDRQIVGRERSQPAWAALHTRAYFFCGG